MKDDTKMKFNENLEILMSHYEGIEYEVFYNYVMIFSKEEERDPTNANEGWF